jgi:hypothetical protein
VFLLRVAKLKKMGRKLASIKGFPHGPPSLWEAAQGRLLYGGWISARFANLAPKHLIFTQLIVGCKPWGIICLDLDAYYALLHLGVPAGVLPIRVCGEFV